ncbi:unnamed protein product [Strongylus vulgaris]|uniref:Uncharacterized protein n=1 Tax=Strongylus vulgaris TaxID=40348 RepID=A0A3P7JFG8_STRVU|nr:unnamed protein product [Strongylus vulgaris]
MVGSGEHMAATVHLSGCVLAIFIFTIGSSIIGSRFNVFLKSTANSGKASNNVFWRWKVPSRQL